jgi:imidazolonepropionase-like amidohydrolase
MGDSRARPADRRDHSFGYARWREAMRPQRHIGAIVPGAYADLIVVNGDPYRNVGVLQHDGAHMAAIMKGGAFAKCSLA